MKKVYLTLAAAIITLGAVAQTIPSGKITPISANEMAKRPMGVGPVKSTNQVVEMYMDYSVANFDDQGFFVVYNSGYVAADTTGSQSLLVNYAAQSVINPIAGYDVTDDPANPTILEFPYLAGPITIDSLFILLGHENNSGTADTVRFELVGANGQGVPNNTVLWSGQETSNVSLSPSGQFTGDNSSIIFSLAPNFTSTQGQRFAINFVYRGSKQDSLRIVGGSVDDNDDTNIGTTNQSLYTNSFIRIPGIIPNVTRNANLQFTDDSFFDVQNWFMWARVTYNVTSITENAFVKGVKIGQNQPNPAGAITSFFYELQNPTNVTIEVRDINGALIDVINEGTKSVGKHSTVLNTNALANGVYTYTLKTNETTVTKRMVVAK